MKSRIKKIVIFHIFFVHEQSDSHWTIQFESLQISKSATQALSSMLHGQFIR